MPGSTIEPERTNPQRKMMTVVYTPTATYPPHHRNSFVAALSLTSAAAALMGMTVCLSMTTKPNHKSLQPIPFPLQEISPLRESGLQCADAELGDELAEQQIGAGNHSRHLVARQLYAANMKQAQKAWENSRAEETVRLLDLYRPATSSETGDSDLRGFEWYYWDRMTSESNERAINAGDPATQLQPLTLVSNSGGIRSVAFSPDSKSLASGSQNGTVTIWDSTNGLLRLSLGEQRSGRHLFYSETELPGSPSALAGDPRKVYRPVGEAQLFQNASAGSERPGTEVRSSADVVTPFPERDGIGLPPNKDPVAATSVVFSSDGSRLASAGRDGSIKVWDSSSGQLTRQTPYSTEINGLAFSWDGTRLASARNDGTIRVWQPGDSGQSFTVRAHSGSVKSVAFSPDGFSLASAGSEGTVKSWDAANGYELSTFMGHTGMVTSVVFSPDGAYLASASNDQTIKVWNTRNGKELLSLNGHTGTVTSLVFSPDGQRLVSGSYDQTVKVWDATSGLELLTLKGHTGTVTTVAFSREGRRIVSGSYDQTVKIWDARPQTAELEAEP